jgi:hypothetical protein
LRIPFFIVGLLGNCIVSNFFVFLVYGFFDIVDLRSLEPARGGLAIASSGIFGTTVSNELLSFELKFLKMSLLRKRALSAIDGRVVYATGCIRALAFWVLTNIFGISPCSL